MLVSIIRSVTLYLMLIAVIRLLGKRQLADMEPSEFVVTLLIADIASIPMQDLESPLFLGIIPIVTIFILEYVLSLLSYRSILFRKVLCGKPVILMENGKIIQNNLKRSRITPDELSEHLREKDVLDLSTVQYAILETNGQISVILNAKDQPVTPEDLSLDVKPHLLPYTIISNGTLLSHNLSISGYDDIWLDLILKKYNSRISDIFLLTVDESGQVYISIHEKHDRSK